MLNFHKGREVDTLQVIPASRGGAKLAPSCVGTESRFTTDLSLSSALIKLLDKGMQEFLHRAEV